MTEEEFRAAYPQIMFVRTVRHGAGNGIWVYKLARRFATFDDVTDALQQRDKQGKTPRLSEVAREVLREMQEAVLDPFFRDEAKERQGTEKLEEMFNVFSWVEGKLIHDDAAGYNPGKNTPLSVVSAWLQNRFEKTGGEGQELRISVDYRADVEEFFSKKILPTITERREAFDKEWAFEQVSKRMGY